MVLTVGEEIPLLIRNNCVLAIPVRIAIRPSDSPASILLRTNLLKDSFALSAATLPMAIVTQWTSLKSVAPQEINRFVRPFTFRIRLSQLIRQNPYHHCQVFR